MANPETILANFHKSTSGLHPDNSIGNQQVFDQGTQVGAIEYIPNLNGTLDLVLTSRKAQVITKL